MRQTFVRGNLNTAVHPFAFRQVLVVQILFFSEQHCYGMSVLDFCQLWSQKWRKEFWACVIHQSHLKKKKSVVAPCLLQYSFLNFILFHCKFVIFSEKKKLKIVTPDENHCIQTLFLKFLRGISEDFTPNGISLFGKSYTLISVIRLMVKQWVECFLF